MEEEILLILPSILPQRMSAVGILTVESNEMRGIDGSSEELRSFYDGDYLQVRRRMRGRRWLKDGLRSRAKLGPAPKHYR